MTREFTPGDVVLDPDQTGAARVALVVSPHFSGCPSAHREYGVHVHYGDGDWNALKDRFMPLVVISPEDRESVERLWRHTGDGGIDDLQYALREYANPKPPKPEEPQGLGAVVEDERGDAWVLINVAGEEMKPVRQWRTWWGNRPWTDIAVVRVLSPGVEVDQ